MTKLSNQAKIDSWENVKETINEISENIPDHTSALSLPYGLQNHYTISHQEPVRILLHPNMNDYDTFVTHHGKAKKFYLDLWTVNHKDCPEKGKIKLQQNLQLRYQIKNIIYVPTHRCFVAFAIDLTLRVFATINFTEMSCVQTSHSVLSLFYNACRDDILAGCLGFVMIWKFPHAQNGCLVPTQKIDCPSISSDYWVTWIKSDKTSKQLLINCEEAIVILDEETYKLRYNFKIDFRHRLPFTACAFYHPNCYFITGSKDFAVKVWNTSMKQCPLVTTFNGHCNAITALEVDNLHHLVISSSTDKTIRLWCLETFAQTFCLETGEEVQHMELMTSRRLFYQSHEHIRVWNLNHFHKLFTVLGFEIVTSRRVTSRGCPTRLLLQGEDGAIRIVSPSDGKIITTMFPLETIPEKIVDYAYNPREERLYVVLSSGAILVFRTRTNPCSTYELWKSDDKVVSIAMMDLQDFSETEDIALHYSLLFGGFHNGQIALIHSNKLKMNDSIEAHYGNVVLLRVSQAQEHDTATSRAKYLVSAGMDCLLKIWTVIRCSPDVVTLEIWSVVKLSSVPEDMDMIGNTIGLVTNNNSFMTCRLNSAIVQIKKKKANRDSLSNYDHHNVEIFTSVSEEKHSKSISGLSACPALGLFATSSYDWSIKVWNNEAKLVKEINFDESLRGVCFANSRGDILVGFQSHISIVPLTTYLPMNFLEKLLSMTFPDDVFEEPLPFDRLLTFSYDPKKTPSLPIDLHQRKVLKEQKTTLRNKPILKIPSTMLAMDNQSELEPANREFEVAPRRYSTTQEQDELDEKLRKFQRSSMSRRSSAIQSPLLEEVIARITQSFSSHSELTETKSQSCSLDVLSEQLRKMFEGDDEKIPDDYWPCAPDGFIPNSVVRLRVPPKKLPPHLQPRLLRGDDLNEWFKNTKKKRVVSSKIPEDAFSPITIDDDMEFYSIFDGYKELQPLGDEKRQPEDDDDEDASSDDEADLRKKWKASTKTTIDKDAMQSKLRTRRQMNERKKVSKKPNMPMIMAEPEDTEDEDEIKTETFDESAEEKLNDEPEEEAVVELPDILMKVMRQPWFPKTTLAGMTTDNILGEMFNVMADCAPMTYNKICNEILAIRESIGLSDNLKEQTGALMADNLSHPSTTIRKASIKTVMELNYTSTKAVIGIVSCLNDKSADLRNDAKNALEHLLGIKDKEALRDLFVSLDILTLTPSPISVASTPEFETIFRLVQNKKELSRRELTEERSVENELSGFLGEWSVDKSRFIQDWLTDPKEEKEIETNKVEDDDKDVSPKESRNVALAVSILSKLKLYKKEPRLSIIDLTFDDSSSESSTISVEEEPRFVEKSPDDDVYEELRKSKAGWKLLSRMGCTKSVNYPKDPSLSHEEHEKHDKRPPSALMGFAYGKMEGETLAYQEQDPTFPEINISEVSSLPISEGQQQDSNKLFLPKIFNRAREFRKNPVRNNMNFRKKRRHVAKDLLTIPVDMNNYQPLPRINTSGSQRDLLISLDTVDQTAYKSKFPIRAARRLVANEEPLLLDSERRKSIVKELQRRRRVIVKNKEISPTLPRSEPSKRHSSLASMPDVHGSPGSLYPSADSTQDATPEINLPKINVFSKLPKPNNTPAAGILVSDDKPGLVGRTVQPVQYVYPIDKDNYGCGVMGERLSQYMSVRVKKEEEYQKVTELNNELLRMLSVDPKLTVDTGKHKWGRSRYGILEVMWTAMNLDGNLGEHVGPLVEELNTTKQITGEKERFLKKSNNVKCPPMAVKRLLKPIRNRNLVTNPFINNTKNHLRTAETNIKNFPKNNCNSECLRSTPSCCDSAKSLAKSDEEFLTNCGQCTFRELLNI